MKIYYKYQKTGLWRRFLRMICGGQDFVCVVFITESGYKNTAWFTGVNMQNPLDVERCASVLSAVTSDHEKT